MPDKKIKIMSLSLEPELHEHIKNSAKRLGHKNVSKMIRELISNYLDLMVNEGDETPVLLKVPNEIRNDEEELKKWLSVKVEALSKALLKK